MGFLKNRELSQSFIFVHKVLEVTSIASVARGVMESTDVFIMLVYWIWGGCEGEDGKSPTGSNVKCIGICGSLALSVLTCKSIKANTFKKVVSLLIFPEYSWHIFGDYKQNDLIGLQCPEKLFLPPLTAFVLVKIVIRKIPREGAFLTSLYQS